MSVGSSVKRLAASAASPKSGDAKEWQTASAATESPMQKYRREWKPELPEVLSGAGPCVVEEIASSPTCTDALLQKLFPNSYAKKAVALGGSVSACGSCSPMKVAVVLSGGQAAGGHNVISGIFDYVKKINAESTLYGFKNGPRGVFTHEYLELNSEIIDRFRNMGGFDMICSGRDKIESDEQKAKSMEICKSLDLDGLVIIGGDDSNTNAAILAEYFAANGSKTSVVGVPKTIDGDLKNEFIECSFGFDTATKIYSELVGNLCVDARSHRNQYHFVRVMGRSATNIALEVQLQTYANLLLVGEEIEKKNMSLSAVCDEIVDMVVARSARGDNFGVVLVPEGLIEFIPEVGQLIREINEILARHAFEKSKLSENSRKVFDELPQAIQEQLLLDRDSHGNVQVAKIATEALLVQIVERRLRELRFDAPFAWQAHYFGYEGRCAMPSDFDANYCYALGHTAGNLISQKATGYMAVVRELYRAPKTWVPGGCPIVLMMNMERRKGKDVPVIKKYLVELERPLFKLYASKREHWKLASEYRSPGPIQFSGPMHGVSNFMILPMEHPQFGAMFESQCSPCSSPAQRAAASCAEMGERVSLQVASQLQYLAPALPVYVPAEFLAASPASVKQEGEEEYHCVAGGAAGPADGAACGAVAVVAAGEAAPGLRNVISGVVVGGGSEVVYCTGVDELVRGACQKVDEEFLGRNTNLGGAPGCSMVAVAPTPAELDEACAKLGLQAVVFVGDMRAVQLVERYRSCKVPSVCVPVSATNEIGGVRCVGYHTMAKTFSALVGNLLTDAASATKYSYFVRVMSGSASSALAAEVAMETHANGCVMAESYTTLSAAVDALAGIVKRRIQANKNFGCYLIPDALSAKAEPLASIVQAVREQRAKGSSQQELARFVETQVPKDWPETFKQALSQPTASGDLDYATIPVEALLAQLVREQLRREGLDQRFAPVCYYLGLQARGAFPSVHDASLAVLYGQAAVCFVRNNVSSVVLDLVDAAAPLSDCRVKAIPLRSAAPAPLDLASSDALKQYLDSSSAYALKDMYCNPGPVQMDIGLCNGRTYLVPSRDFGSSI